MGAKGWIAHERDVHLILRGVDFGLVKAGVVLRESRGVADGFAETERNANQGQRHTLSQNHRQHPAAVCAQRHSNSYLVRTLRNRISHHAVETDRRQLLR